MNSDTNNNQPTPSLIDGLKESVGQIQSALSVWTPDHRREEIGAKLAVQAASDIERGEMLIEKLEAVPDTFTALADKIRAAAEAEGTADNPSVTKAIDAMLEFRDEYCRVLGITPPKAIS